MSLIAAAAVEVGEAIAKSVFKLWVKNSELRKDISSSLIDLVGSKASNTLTQRKDSRQLKIREIKSDSLTSLIPIDNQIIKETILVMQQTLGYTLPSLNSRNIQKISLGEVHRL